MISKEELKPIIIPISIPIGIIGLLFILVLGFELMIEWGLVIPVEECKTRCFMFGTFTPIGWLIFITLIFAPIVVLRFCWKEEAIK